MIRAAMPYAMGAVVAVAIAASLYGWGHRAGRMAEAGRIAAAVAQMQARYDDHAEAARRAEAARLWAERSLTHALQQQTADALADPSAGRPALGPASVQRLNGIRRAD